MKPVIVIEVPHQSQATGYVARSESELPEDTHDLFMCHIIGEDDYRDYLLATNEKGQQRRHQAARIAALVDDFSIILGWREKGK